MKQVLHYLIGKAVSSRPGFALLKWYAFRTPHKHLYDLDGSLYMGRWRVVDEGTRGSKILAILTGYTHIRLHRICRADHDRELHNHPFDYRTYVAKGFYAEQYEEPPPQRWAYETHHGYRFVHVGGTATGSHEKFHRIDLIPTEGVWTMFCMKADKGDWGFERDGEYIPSRVYFAQRGYVNDGKGQG